MKKLKDIIALLNVPMLVFIGYGIRLILVGASIGDSLSLIAISALYGIILYFDYNKKPDVSQEIKIELDHIKQNLALVKMTKGINTNENSKQTYRF